MEAGRTAGLVARLPILQQQQQQRQSLHATTGFLLRPRSVGASRHCHRFQHPLWQQQHNQQPQQPPSSWSWSLLRRQEQQYHSSPPSSLLFAGGAGAGGDSGGSDGGPSPQALQVRVGSNRDIEWDRRATD